MICPSCHSTLDEDSIFCEFCGTQVKNYSSPASNSLANLSKQKSTKKAPIIILSVLLGIFVIGAAILGYLYYSDGLYYSEQLERQEKKITELTQTKNSVASERDKYKSERDDYKKRYEKERLNTSTFNLLMDKIKDVSPTNVYGGFNSKVYAVKKGDRITINFPYSYSGTVNAWYDSGYDFAWKDSSYGYLKCSLKGTSVGVFILRVNHTDKKAEGGITTVIYVYE